MGPGGHVGRLTPGAGRRAAIATTVSVAVGAILLAPVQVCPFALIFHAPCPGCGLTRAAVHLLSGDLRGAFALHPLSILLVPLLGSILGTQVWRYVARRDRTGGSRSARWRSLS
jgi:uncharacterized protein YqgC (DUF456 family)